MKILLLAFGLSMLLSSCGIESDAKKAVLGSLKDPDSAKFGEFTQVDEYACLTVNARNSMGGYTGDQQATLNLINKEWTVVSIAEISHDTCISSVRSILKEKHVLEQQNGELENRLTERKRWEDEGRLKKCSEIKDCPNCPKLVLSDCQNCLDMVAIPAGSFEMGEVGSSHLVTLKGFEIGKTEVTQGQWKAVMGINPSHFPNCGDNIDDNFPVEQVSWDEIKEFIQKLNSKTGKQYRLPTEAEWEYACRAGGRNEYCGSDNIDSVAWHGAGETMKGNSAMSTNRVATKQANTFGLYDMSGNVDEWVEDRWHDNYNGAPTDGSAWQGGHTDGHAWQEERIDRRVARGGSWDDAPKILSAANRGSYPSTNNSDYVGFRLAKSLP